MVDLRIDKEECMKWTFPRPLNGLELVKLIEQDYKIKLPSLYIEIIKDGNAAIPE